jgi:hypothetical protein
MSCNSCSNITLPGVVGPAGAPGAAGAAGNGIVSVSFQSTTNPGGTPTVAGYTDTYRITYTDATTFDYNIVNGTVGTNGTDGVAVIDIDTSSIPHTSNTPTAVKTTNISDNTIGTVGDFIKVKGNILISKVEGYVPKVEVKFDGNTMFVQYLGSFGGSIGSMLGLRFEVDLIVTATNTIRPHVRFEAMDETNVGNKYMIGNISRAFDGVIDFYQSSVTLNSGGPRAITVELTSDNVNTVALTYYEVTKYLKA